MLSTVAIHVQCAYCAQTVFVRNQYVVVVSSSHQSPSCAVSWFRSTQSIAILLSVWSASKGSLIGGGCHEATDHCHGNGCALLGRFSSCTDQGFGCDRCAFVPT